MTGAAQAADRPVRLGVIGCGSVFGAYGSLIESSRMHGHAEVVAACDVDSGKREEVLRRWPRASFSTHYGDVVNLDEVDLVLVLTAMPAHGAVTRAALEAGKHVLVEKPMATTLQEAQALLADARQAPGLLLCAPHVCLSPTFQTILRRVREGDVGRVLLARGRYGHSGPTWGPWYYRQGGGALFDLAVYNLTALTGLLGPVRRVTAFGGTAIPKRVVEGVGVDVEVIDNAQILLDFGETVYATVTTGFTMQKYRSPAIELYGTGGTIQMMGDDWAPEGYELWQPSADAWQIYADADPRWPWTQGLAHLVDCIRDGTQPVGRPEHAFHVLEVILAAEASAGDGRAREIESVFPPLEIPGVPAPASMPEHDRRVERVT